jgi:hypothetical protein
VSTIRTFSATSRSPSAAHFSRQTSDLYLVTRLDGFIVERRREADRSRSEDDH